MVERRGLKWFSVALVSLLAIVMALALAIGPGITWDLLSHGPTTVWDHLEYPTRSLDPSPEAMPWETAISTKSQEFPAFDPDEDLVDAITLDIAGGIEVVHTPGHASNHVALLWKHDRGLLFAGDAAANIMGLSYSLGYEDFEVGKSSLRKVADLDFEVAAFGHGKPILSSASSRFFRRFG